MAYGFVLLEARGFPQTKSLQLPLNQCDRSLLFELLLFLLFQTPGDFHGNSIPATPGLVLTSVICSRVTVHNLQRGAAGPQRCLLHWGVKDPSFHPLQPNPVSPGNLLQPSTTQGLQAAVMEHVEMKKKILEVLLHCFGTQSAGPTGKPD